MTNTCLNTESLLSFRNCSDMVAVTCVFYTAFTQHSNHGRPSHGSLMAESPTRVQTFLSTLDNWVDYNLAEAVKAM